MMPMDGGPPNMVTASIREALSRGLNFLEGGDLKAAATAFNEAGTVLAQTPESPALQTSHLEYLTSLGLLYMSDKNPGVALSFFLDVARRQSMLLDRPEPLVSALTALHCSEALSQLHRIPLSQSYAKGAVMILLSELHPGVFTVDATARSLLATAHLRVGTTSEALGELHEALTAYGWGLEVKPIGEGTRQTLEESLLRVAARLAGEMERSGGVAEVEGEEERGAARKSDPPIAVTVAGERVDVQGSNTARRPGDVDSVPLSRVEQSAALASGTVVKVVARTLGDSRPPYPGLLDATRNILGLGKDRPSRGGGGGGEGISSRSGSSSSSRRGSTRSTRRSSSPGGRPPQPTPTPHVSPSLSRPATRSYSPAPMLQSPPLPHPSTPSHFSSPPPPSRGASRGASRGSTAFPRSGGGGGGGGGSGLRATPQSRGDSRGSSPRLHSSRSGSSSSSSSSRRGGGGGGGEGVELPPSLSYSPFSRPARLTPGPGLGTMAARTHALACRPEWSGSTAVKVDYMQVDAALKLDRGLVVGDAPPPPHSQRRSGSPGKGGSFERPPSRPAAREGGRRGEGGGRGGGGGGEGRSPAFSGGLGRGGYGGGDRPSGPAPSHFPPASPLYPSNSNILEFPSFLLEQVSVFELSGGGGGGDGGGGGGGGGWGDGGGAYLQQQQQHHHQSSVGGGNVREDAQAFLASFQASTSVIGGGGGARGAYPPSPSGAGAPFQG